ncbi:hypothetical protein SAVIM338S_07269 [Streptomyces avidinii]
MAPAHHGGTAGAGRSRAGSTARRGPAVSSGGDRLAADTRGADPRGDDADVVAAACRGQAAGRSRAQRNPVAASPGRAGPPGQFSRPRAALPAPAGPGHRQPADDEPRLPVRSTASIHRGVGRSPVLGAQQKPGISGKAAGWTCAVCGTAPAAVLDHCHEHGYVRAPVCQSCNTQECPDHLYSNDIRVADRYTRLFDTDTDTVDWLRHWHRCPARTTLPLPHLAAWTAHTAWRPLRPTHRGSRGRTPCGVLRVFWTGSQNTPRSCLLTVAVDFCPSGEHRVLARVPYREAAERFGTWLAETAHAEDYRAAEEGVAAAGLRAGGASPPALRAGGSAVERPHQTSTPPASPHRRGFRPCTRAEAAGSSPSWRARDVPRSRTRVSLGGGGCRGTTSL